MLPMLKILFTDLFIVGVLVGLRMFLQQIRFYQKNNQAEATIISKQTYIEGRGISKYKYTVLKIEYFIDKIKMEAELEFYGVCDWAEEGSTVNIVYGDKYLKEPEIIGHHRKNGFIRILDVVITTILVILLAQFLTF